MSDIGTTVSRGASTGLDFSPARIADLIKRSDLGLAIGIMAILVVLILPLPTWMLDVSLAFSLSFAILILMTAVFIRKPLEFSSFPTILLITTMLRLALNLASTRLILGHGNEGTAASGYVMRRDGNGTDMADVLAASQHTAALHKASSLRTLSLVALAHWVSHFHMLVLPMLFPFLKTQLGVGYVELGFAMTVFAVTTALVASDR